MALGVAVSAAGAVLALFVAFFSDCRTDDRYGTGEAVWLHRLFVHLQQLQRRIDLIFLQR